MMRPVVYGPTLVTLLLLALSSVEALAHARWATGGKMGITVALMLLVMLAGSYGLKPPFSRHEDTPWMYLAGAMSLLLAATLPAEVERLFAIVPALVGAYHYFASALRSHLAQLSSDLWETSWLLGATQTQTLRYAVLPASPELLSETGRAAIHIALSTLPTMACFAW